MPDIVMVADAVAWCRDVCATVQFLGPGVVCVTSKGVRVTDRDFLAAVQRAALATPGYVYDPKRHRYIPTRSAIGDSRTDQEDWPHP